MASAQITKVIMSMAWGISFDPSTQREIASATSISSRHPNCPQVRKEEKLWIAATMGIKGLFQVIKDECPGAYKEGDIKNQFGRKVAIVGVLQKSSVD